MQRALKRLAAIAAMLMLLAVATSLTRAEHPEPEQGPDATQLAAMRNEAALSPGLAKIYAEQYPEYAGYILGE